MTPGVEDVRKHVRAAQRSEFVVTSVVTDSARDGMTAEHFRESTDLAERFLAALQKVTTASVECLGSAASQTSQPALRKCARRVPTSEPSPIFTAHSTTGLKSFAY